MSYDGTIRFDTSMDFDGFQKDANSFTSFVKGLGVFKVVQKGLQAVTSSIDDAVARYDTLNKFPKVLEQMGYSAQDASTATDRLSKGVQGLPTTLDDIVSNTQRIVSVTGELDKSVALTLALNDAFLASGASSDDASRGLTQFIQMLSKGSVDMQSWRTLQETMTYGLNRLAEAFGYTGSSAVNDLYAALQSGDITMTQFADKIVELDSGVGGFAEVAKTATGGIGTAWTNMQVAIVRGTTNIIDAIDEGLSGTKFGSIENIIKGLGNTSRAVLTGVANNLDLVINGVVALSSAFLAKKGIDAWRNALNQVNIAQEVAAGQGRTLSDVLRKDEDGAKRASVAYLQQEASIKKKEAAQKSAIATTLEGIAAAKQAEAAAAREAAQRAKSTEQIKAEKEAAKANSEASRAEAKARRLHAEAVEADKIAVEAETRALAEGATELEKASALTSRAAAIDKQHAAAAADKTAQEKRETAAIAEQNVETLKSIEYQEADTAATQAETVAKEAAAVSETAKTAATQAETAATVAQTAAQNAENTSLTVGQALVALMTGNISLLAAGTVVATSVMTAFKTALMSLPFMLLTTGIGALISGLGKYIFSAEHASEETQHATDVLERYKQAATDAKDALEQDTQSYEDNAAAAKANADVTRANAAAVERAVDAYKNGAMSSDELQARLDVLNSSCEGLNVTFDKTTGALSMSHDELNAYIDASEQAAKKSALSEHMKKLQENLADTNAELYKGRLELDLLYEELGEGPEYDAYEKELTAHLNSLADTAKKIKDDMSRYEGEYSAILKEESAARSKAILEQDAKIKEFAETYHVSYSSIKSELNQSKMTFDEWSQENMEQLEANKIAIEEFAEEWGISTDAIAADIARQGITFEEWKANWEDMAAAVSEKTDGIVNNFERIPTEFEMSAQEMLENLQANKETYAAWETNMEEITRQLGPTAADEFRKLGPEANSAIEEILASTDLLDQYRETFGVKIDEATGAAIENWNDPAFIGAASSAIDTSAAEVQLNTSLSDAAADKVAETKEAMMTAVTDVGFKEIGDDISDAIESGFDTVDVDAGTAINKMTQAIVNYLKSSVTRVKPATKNVADAIILILDGIEARAKQSVSKAMSSFVKAIDDTQPQAIQAAQHVVNGTISGIDTLQTKAYNSGYNIGRMTGSGMYNGLISMQSAIFQKASYIANTVISRMQNALDIHSPSGKSEWLFKMLVAGGIKGLEKNKPTLYKAIDDMDDGIIARMVKIARAMSDTFDRDVRFAIEANHGPAPAAAIVYPAEYLRNADKSVSTVNNYNMTSVFNSPKALGWRETVQHETAVRQQLEMLGT